MLLSIARRPVSLPLSSERKKRVNPPRRGRGGRLGRRAHGSKANDSTVCPQYLQLKNIHSRSLHVMQNEVVDSSDGKLHCMSQEEDYRFSTLSVFLKKLAAVQEPNTKIGEKGTPAQPQSQLLGFFFFKEAFKSNSLPAPCSGTVPFSCLIPLDAENNHQLTGVRRDLSLLES